MNALFLAFAHLRWTWARSTVLILVGALILAVPLVTQTLLRGSEDALTRRPRPRRWSLARAAASSIW